MRTLAAGTSYGIRAHLDVQGTNAFFGSFADSQYSRDGIKSAVAAGLRDIGRLNGDVVVEPTHNLLADDVVAISCSIEPASDTDTDRVGNIILANAQDVTHNRDYRLVPHHPYTWSIAGQIVDESAVTVSAVAPNPSSSAGGLGILLNAAAITSTVDSTDPARDGRTEFGIAASEVAAGHNPFTLSTSVKVTVVVIAALASLVAVGYVVRSFK